jgi:hypothetical protein
MSLSFQLSGRYLIPGIYGERYNLSAMPSLATYARKLPNYLADDADACMRVPYKVRRGEVLIHIQIHFRTPPSTLITQVCTSYSTVPPYGFDIAASRQVLSIPYRVILSSV